MGKTSLADVRCASDDVDAQAGFPEASWSAEDERRLVRKIDFRIFPILIVLFILKFIDR